MKATQRTWCTALAGVTMLFSLGATAMAQDEVVITWSNPDTLEWQATYQQIADAFMAKHPNIKVEMEVTPSSGYRERLFTSIAAGTAPDVFTFYFATETAERGFFEDLTPYIERDGLNPEELWFPIARERAMYNDRYYSVPRDTVYLTFAYNKEIFENAGVEPPTDAWTPDEMMEKLVAVTTQDNQEQQIYGTTGVALGMLLWHPFSYTLGANVVDETGRQVQGYLDSPETIKAIQFILDLEESSVAVPEFFSQQASDQETSVFGSGQVALTVMEWNLALFFDLDFEWDSVSPPLEPGVERLAWGDSVQHYMWSGSQHKEEAWELLKFISGPEAGLIAAESGSWAPPNPSVWQELGWDTHPVYIGRWEQAQLPTATPNYLRSEFFSETVRPHIDNIWTRHQELGERPLEDIVRDEAAQAQSELDRAYERNR